MVNTRHIVFLSHSPMQKERAWIVQDAPGSRLVVSIEATRSYRVGLARATMAARQAVVECAQLSRGRPATSAALRRGRSPGAGMVGGEAGAVGEPDQRGVAGSPAADRAPEPHRGHRHRPGSAMKTVESSAAPGVATGNGEQTSVGGERYDTAPVSFIRPSGTGNERRSRRAPSGRRRPQLRLPPQRVAGTPLS